MAWDVIADIGGTNMRLAMVIDGAITRQVTRNTAGPVAVCEALAAFCDEISGVEHMPGQPGSVFVAAAGIVDNGAVRLTNGGQAFSETDLVKACGAGKSRILNDFEAAAWSMVSLNQEDVLPLQGPDLAPDNRAPRVIVGPGTGLGVASLVWAGKAPLVVPGEGGHVGIGPREADDVSVFQGLAELWPETRMGTGLRLEAEAILSGTGIPVLMRALYDLDGRNPGHVWTAADVFQAARDGTDQLATKAIDLFGYYLGAACGDLALIMGARGGVFLCGGVLLANSWLFDRPAFLSGFNAGGRHTAFRETVPVYLYKSEAFGLNGVLNAMRFQMC